MEKGTGRERRRKGGKGREGQGVGKRRAKGRVGREEWGRGENIPAKICLHTALFGEVSVQFGGATV